MYKKLNKSLLLLSFLMLSAVVVSAQTSQDSKVITYSIIGVVLLVIIAAIMMVSENLLQVESKRVGIEQDEDGPISIYPKGSFFKKPIPKDLKGKNLHILKEGYNIKLVGAIDYESVVKVERVMTSRYAVQPKNFRGIAPIPKVILEEGSTVKAGDPIFFDKSNPDIHYVAPVSGEYVELVRGEKRSINELVIIADKEQQFRSYEAPAIDAPRDQLVKFLMGSGVWPLINKRPFNTIADPNVVPRDIFISTFDTAPLAPQTNYLVEGYENEVKTAIQVLSRLTDGYVYLGLNANDVNSNPSVFTQAEGVGKHYFKGPHPAGNVGIQIHHIKPIKTGETVWTMNVQDLITLGGLFTQGKFISDRTIAITGQDAVAPKYIKTQIGANIGELLQGEILESDEKVRIISGDVLSGYAKTKDNYLDASCSQITLIPEGDYYEPFGWLLPQSMRPSVSHSFPNFVFPGIKYKTDTNTHGEKRAFVMTGQYEELLPMNIYLQHLMKAIMINDFERMEGLGILELSEEDVALAEFACTSKMPLQEILRSGLEEVQKQS